MDNLQLAKQYIEQKLKHILNTNLTCRMLSEYMIYHIKYDNKYYFCHINGNKTSNFVTIINVSKKQDPIEALHEMFDFKILDTTNAYNVFPLTCKKTKHQYKHIELIYQNNKLIGRAWRDL